MSLTKLVLAIGLGQTLAVGDHTEGVAWNRSIEVMNACIPRRVNKGAIGHIRYPCDKAIQGIVRDY